MPRITHAQIHSTYDYSKKIRAEEITENEASNEVSTTTGMNLGSANGYIKTCLSMMSGEGYSRTINAYGTEYFLKKIHQDSGEAALNTALSAVRKHLKSNNNPQNNIRNIVETYTKKLKGVTSLESIKIDFDKQVEISRKYSQSFRKSRLESSTSISKKTTVQVTVFLRNPDVVAEVLSRANGDCEECRNPAPFIREKDNTPFLEVHHIEQLANGGKDSVSNAIALCPNCHRELHYGKKA